jgi:hypothetical protein
MHVFHTVVTERLEGNCQNVSESLADPSVRAVWGVGLRPLGCWGRGFESRSGHGYLSVVLSCVGRGLCDGLITRPEESYHVSVCVWSRNPEKGGQRSILDYKRLWMNEWIESLTGTSILNKFYNDLLKSDSDKTANQQRAFRLLPPDANNV